MHSRCCSRANRSAQSARAKSASSIAWYRGPRARGSNRSGTVVASKSSYVQRIGKESFYQQRELPLAEASELTTRVMTENMLARDAEEGIGAFVEKRTPKWEDR